MCRPTTPHWEALLARIGPTVEAMAYAARLALLAHRDGPSLAALARTGMSLGQHDRALTLLEQEVRVRMITIPFQTVLGSDPQGSAVPSRDARARAMCSR